MADNRGMPQDPYGSPYPNDPNQGYNQPYPNDPYSAQPQMGDPYAAQDPYSAAPAGDPYNMGGGVDPYSGGPVMPSDPYGGQAQGGFDPNMPGSMPPAGQDFGYNPQDPYAAPNTFEEKRTGNRVFLVAVIAVISLLVIVAGVLIYYSMSQGGDNPGQNNPQTGQNGDSNGEDEEIPQLEPNIAKTGGENTPATKARQHTDAKLQKDWLLRSFQGQPYIDSEGNCTNESRCGENGDPDNDGVINIEEYNFGTDPIKSDTDNDGIADGDELYVYYTDPTQKDSDGDGYEDFIELANCYSPVEDTQGEKMTSSGTGLLNLNKIESNVELNPLRSITRSSFTREDANASDITKGYIAERCVPVEPVEGEEGESEAAEEGEEGATDGESTQTESEGGAVEPTASTQESTEPRI